MSLRVQVHDAQGVELQPEAELAYLHGGYGELPAALERALEGRSWCSTATIRWREWPSGFPLK